MKPILNILIRTSYRPEAFTKCIHSILTAYIGCERFLNLTIVIGYDQKIAGKYMWENALLIDKANINFKLVDLCGIADRENPFFYNLYCNNLLSEIDSGHSIFIDDDDIMISENLIRIIPHLKRNESLVIPFMRGDFQKPTHNMMLRKKITMGYIGMPCIVIWHEHIKHINFIASEVSDFQAINSLSIMTNLSWVEIPLVKSFKRSLGILE